MPLLPARLEAYLKPVVLAGAVVLAAAAGWTDLRSRRIPNWLTVRNGEKALGFYQEAFGAKVVYQLADGGRNFG